MRSYGAQVVAVADMVAWGTGGRAAATAGQAGWLLLQLVQVDCVQINAHSHRGSSVVQLSAALLRDIQTLPTTRLAVVAWLATGCKPIAALPTAHVAPVSQGTCAVYCGATA